MVLAATLRIGHAHIHYLYKHQRIGKQGTRRIDHVVARAAIVSLVVIDIGCKDRGMLMC